MEDDSEEEQNINDDYQFGWVNFVFILVVVSGIVWLAHFMF